MLRLVLARLPPTRGSRKKDRSRNENENDAARAADIIALPCRTLYIGPQLVPTGDQREK